MKKFFYGLFTGVIAIFSLVLFWKRDEFSNTEISDETLSKDSDLELDIEAAETEVTKLETEIGSLDSEFDIDEDWNLK